MDHGQVVFRVAFPASDDAAVIVQPGEQPLDLPAPTRPAQAAPVLRRRPATVVAVRRDQLHPVPRPQPTCQPVAVVGFIADQPLRRLPQEPLLEGGFDEADLMRSSAGQVHGERKTMAVCDRHDLAAFTAPIIAHSSAPFFASLKLPSMNASDKSNWPRSRKSSASFLRMRVSRPVRCHC